VGEEAKAYGPRFSFVFFCARCITRNLHLLGMTANGL